MTPTSLRRRAFMALPLAAFPLLTNAQASRPVRCIVPSAAGGAPDATMRMLTQEITKLTGTTFVIDNKPGAAGVIGITDLVRQPPDGQTIAYVNNVTLSINRSAFKKLAYDPKTLSPVALLFKGANVIVVNPRVPATSLQELLAYAKANPDKLAYGSPGQGTSGHLTGEFLATKTGVQIKHIPYRGAPQALTDLLGGQFDMMIDNLPNVLSYVREGKLRAIAVTSLTRNPQLPEVPTVAESGYPGFEAVAWGGVAMPPGTPENLGRDMNALFMKAMQSDRAQRFMREAGNEVVANPDPQALRQYADAEAVKWAAVIKQAGIEPQ